ncbi:NADAR family protein [Hassallia byssoidea VB512170]|uniref:NADAR family protein n=1 Tax=Hassallia byssoidea VB512170 TaxID=1304833 RepID=A0A846H3N3_9CYAN|nr:NADAR family protein [Hassalia byssoidea]NEU71713.1 NADAR family protein [Hassalia byssoidea VB512170]
MKSWIKNWFSNLEVLQNPIVVDGIDYWSVENFYAASKSLDVKEKMHIALLPPDAAKKYALKVALRPDWEQVKLSIMLRGLLAKFSPGSNWHNELIETGGEELIEFSKK